MSNVSRASFLLTILSGCGSLLLVTTAHAQDVLELAADDLLVQHEQLQRQLAELESIQGRHDPALIEILSSLAGSSARLSLYSEASVQLDRSLQIQRLSHGLFSPEQIPLIQTKMEIDARAGDWEAVNGSIDYLYWLLMGKNVSAGEALVDNLILLSELHLRGVVADAADQQAYHYQQAAKITLQALTITKESVGPYDPRVIDLNYSLVKQLYLQSVAVERGDDTAYALRAVIPGSKWVTPRRIAQSRYYRAGLRLLHDIRKILAQIHEDPTEPLAMIDIYTADWHLLFDQKQAEVAYKNAFVRLREADVDTTKLSLLFATPKILPIPVFYRTVANALTGDYFVQPPQQLEHDTEPSSDLNFQQWLDAMSIISWPVRAPPLGLAKREQPAEIRLRFRLDSLNQISRWLGGRYRTNMGVATQFDSFESDSLVDSNMESFDERLRLLHFRPRLENGIASPFEGTLLYPAAVN